MAPSFEIPLAEKTDGVDGNDVVFEVKVKGIPTPDLTWFKVNMCVSSFLWLLEWREQFGKYPKNPNQVIFYTCSRANSVLS